MTSNKNGGRSRKGNPVRRLTDLAKRGIAYLLCFSMVLANLPGSLILAGAETEEIIEEEAEEEETYVEIYSMTLDSLCEAAEDAIRYQDPMTGEEYLFAGDDADLFDAGDGLIFEAYPETEGEDSLKLKTFVKLGKNDLEKYSKRLEEDDEYEDDEDEDEDVEEIVESEDTEGAEEDSDSGYEDLDLSSYNVTGNEEIIFLLINDTDEEVSARIRVVTSDINDTEDEGDYDDEADEKENDDEDAVIYETSVITVPASYDDKIVYSDFIIAEDNNPAPVEYIVIDEKEENAGIASLFSESGSDAEKETTSRETRAAIRLAESSSNAAVKAVEVVESASNAIEKNTYSDNATPMKGIWYSSLTVNGMKAAAFVTTLSKLGIDYSLMTLDGEEGENLDGDYAYLTNVGMSSGNNNGYSMTTGTATWDDDDEAGNDSGPNNMILRTFDTATYSVDMETKVRDNAPYKTYKSGDFYFELVVRGTKDEIQWETGSMGWLSSKHGVYTVTSENYDGKTYQVLRGYITLEPSTEDGHAIGETTQELSLVLRALALQNKDTVMPYFTFFMAYNDVGLTDEQYRTWGTEDYDGPIITFEGEDCDGHDEKEYQTVEAPEITISATPRYNLAIVNSTASKTQQMGSYNFSTGNDLALNKDAGEKYGRLGGYGLVLQIVGKDAKSGLRGVQLPKENETLSISFQLDLSSTYTANGTTYTTGTSDNPNSLDLTKYAPLIWSFDENKTGSDNQQDGRVVPTSTKYADQVPYNKLSNNTSYKYASCYDGGTWKISGNTDGTYTVTVTDCTVDMSQLPWVHPGAGTSLSYRYYNPNTINYDPTDDNKNDYWEVETACISAGELWVVQPYYEGAKDDGDTYIAQMLGEGTYSVIASDSVLSIKQGDDVIFDADATQAVTTDDRVGQSMALVNSGSIDQHIAYVKYDYAAYNDPLTDGCFSSAKDWILQGDKLGIETYVTHDSAEEGNTGVAYDVMIKFDDAFFEPDGTIMYSGILNGETRTTLWAAKSDKNGWDHEGLSPDQDGYDTEMINATPDDLIYYSSLNDLKADGATCVGVLVQYRGLMTEQQNHIHTYLLGSNKTTCETDQVYMVTPYCRVWTRNNLAAAMAADPESEYYNNEDAALNALLGMTTNEVKTVVNKYIPTRTASSSLKYENDNGGIADYPDCYWKNGDSRHPTTAEGGSSRTPTILNYVKCYYDESGCHEGTSGNYWGDSCLVVGYKSGLTMKVAQETTAGGNTGEKRVFDMDTDQTVVDYEISPFIERNNGEQSSETKTYTNVEITVVIPENLSYIYDSSYIGGTYETVGEGKQGTVTGGVKLTEAETTTFTYTVDGTDYTVGVMLTVTDDTDGNEVLTYTFTNVPVTGTETTQYLPNIYYSCEISSGAVTNGTELDVTADISCSSDAGIEPTSRANGEAIVGITVTKTTAISLIKTADQTSVDVNKEIGFTMDIGDNSDNAMLMVAVDNIPYNEDGVSTFTNEECEVYVTEFSAYDVNATRNLSDFYFFYTTNKEFAGMTSKDYPEGEYFVLEENGVTSVNPECENDGWIEFGRNMTKNNDAASHTVYTYTGFPTNEQVYAIVGIGEIEGKDDINMHVTLKLSDPEPGDVIVNTFTQQHAIAGSGEETEKTYYDLSDSAHARVVGRTVSGTVWLDEDMDGGIQTGSYEEEQLLSGVKVELQKSENGSWTTAKNLKNGKDLVTKTDSAGYYEFNYVPEGEFRVVLSGTGHAGNEYQPNNAVPYYVKEGYVLNDHEVTVKGADGIDEAHNSNVERSESEEDVIIGITMPAATAITGGTYDVKYQNAGYTKSQDLEVTKEWDDGNHDHSASAIIVTVGDDLENSWKVTLSGDNEWKYTIDELPYYDGNGDPKEYLLTKNIWISEDQDTIPSGYTLKGTELGGSAAEGFTVKLTNTYGAKGSVTFGGEKTIKGKERETIQTFTFELYTTGSDFTVAEDAEATSKETVTGAGSFTFETISYDSDEEKNGAGTYYYVVKETETNENGWVSDTKEYNIEVIVTDGGNGAFALDVKCVDAEGQTVDLTEADNNGENGVYSFTGLDFVNEYKPAPTSVQFTGSKYLSNSTGTNKEFAFDLYDADDSFTIDGDAIDTQTTTGGGTITFEEITYEEVGTHYYVIQEKALDEKEGWTIDSTIYNITVEVTDNDLGQLVADVTVDGTKASGTKVNTENGDDEYTYGGFDFTNAYAAEGNVTLGVLKSINGVASTDEIFSFTLYSSDSDFAARDEIETITTEGSNIKYSTQLNFNAISYDTAGTYYYVIKETGTAPKGWDIDSTEYYVTVTVRDDENGKLITKAYYGYLLDDGNTEIRNSAAFTNTYAATGSLSLIGTKKFTGGTLEANEFTFTMTDSTGKSVGDVTMDANGDITFPILTYDETNIGGEYTYTISEVVPNDTNDSSDSSIVYDNNTYTVDVSVADNGNGTLDVTYTVNGTESGDITFKNYQKGSLTISKTFTGLTEEQIASLTNFTITVTDSEDKTVATLTLNNADEGSSYTWTVSELPADKYTVTESGYSLDGYEVIARSGEVEVADGSDVSVDDTLEWGAEDKVGFTNDYTEVGSITISKYVVAEKDIQEEHKDTEYTVVITASKDANFQWVTVTSESGREITPTINGKTITFTIMENETVTINGLPAEEYTVEEQGSDEMTSEHCVPNYRIGDKDYEEAPSVTVASGEENVVLVEIDNEYPIGTYIMVQKDYNKDEYPEEGFTFVIEALSCDPEAENVTIDAEDMPMPDNTTVTITESGEIGYFGNIEYEHLGTYYYKITETAGNEGYIDYDGSVHYIKVVVEESPSDAAHVLRTDEYDSRADAETDDYKDLEYEEAGIVTAEFINTAYDRLTLEKEVSGNSGDTTEYEFEISLSKDGTGYNGDLNFADEIEKNSGGILTRIANWFSGVISMFKSDDEESGESPVEVETVTFTDGKGTVIIRAGEKVTLMIPSGWECTITEKTTGTDTTTVYDKEGNVIAKAEGTETEAVAKVGTVADSTEVRFVNSYREYFEIDEEIVTDTGDLFNKTRDSYVKRESVNEYNAIEIEMTTRLPVVTPYDLENGEFTMNFHNVLDHELVLDGELADFTVYIDGNLIDPEYYDITIFNTNKEDSAISTFKANTKDDGCTFHVDVDLTALYKDGIITDDMLDGNAEITIFFFADLEGTGLNGTYASTVWYQVYDADELLYTSNVDVIRVYTYEIDITKYDSSVLVGDNYETAALSGAVFGVYYDEACKDPVIRSYSYDSFEDTPEEYQVTSDGEGRAVFYGLADGTYYVKEIKAPAGYILSDKILTVELGPDTVDANYHYNTIFENTPASEKSVDVGDGTGVNIGDKLTYMVSYTNYEDSAEDIMITDKLDENVEYVDGSASDGGEYDKETHTITWALNVDAATANNPTEIYVTYQVKVLASALTPGLVENTASVQINNDPAHVIRTNTVKNQIQTGDLTISKTVSGSGGSTSRNFTFEVELDKNVNGVFEYVKTDNNGVVIDSGTITVKDGKIVTENGETWTFQLQHGQSFTIIGLPSGVEYVVTESDNSGYTVTIDGVTGSSTTNGTTSADGVTVSFTNYRASTSSSGHSGSSGGGVRQGTNSGPGADSSESSSEDSTGSDSSSSIHDVISSDDIGALPQTGEGNTTAVLICLCAVFVVILATLFYMRRKAQGDQP